MATVGAITAIALAAAGPGTPQTTEVGSFFSGALISEAQRTCTGTDGGYTESLIHYQAPSSMTTSSDPRFDGLADFYVHELYLTSPTDGTPRGHIDGTIDWFASDTGPKTAFAKLIGIWHGVEANFGGIDGSIGGPSGNTDGYALPMGTLPRAALYGTVELGETALGLSGSFGAGKESLTNPGTATTGALLQSFSCTGKYQPVAVGTMNPTTLSKSAQRAEIRTMRRRASGKKAAPKRAKLVVPAEAKLPPLPSLPH